MCFFLLTTWSAALWAQKVQDSTKVEVLDEVLVRSVRVEADSPITHSNVSKEEELQKEIWVKISQFFLNYQPSVVTTSDAGAGIGYTGIRIRGVDAQSTNITINGIPYNDQESLGTFWVNLRILLLLLRVYKYKEVLGLQQMVRVLSEQVLIF